MADYHSVLLGAVGKLDPNTAENRRDTYDRARRAMSDRLRAIEPHLPKPVIDVELEKFDQAVERVEAQYGGAAAAVGSGPKPKRSIIVPVMTGLAITGVVIAVGLASLMFGPRIKRDSQGAQAASTPSVSYVYLRQPVYFRTTEPVGTILIDKSQRFVYVVLPNVVALRYGVGVGPECTTAAGLYHVSRKEEWPGRSNSAFGQLRNLIGSDPTDGPLGPRALYFGTDYRLHGTNAPLSIGSSLPAGCFAMLNEAITEFYDKAPAEARVVVMD